MYAGSQESCSRKTQHRKSCSSIFLSPFTNPVLINRQAKITLEPSLYSSNVIEFPSSAVAGVGNDDLITMVFSPQPGPEQYLEPIIPRRKSRTSNQNMDVIQARVEDITFNGRIYFYT